MEVVVASMCHAKYAQAISQEIEKSAQVRKTGIALRSPEYLQEKIKSKHAVVSIWSKTEHHGFTRG